MKNIKTHFNRKKSMCFFLVFVLTFNLAKAQKTVSVFAESNPKVQFALNEIKKAFLETKSEVKLTNMQQADILLISAKNLIGSDKLDQSFQNSGFKLKPEGFYIQKNKQGKIGVIGADEAGLMYGGLELAEQVKLYGLQGIKETG